MTTKCREENKEGAVSGKTLKNHLKKTCLHLDDDENHYFIAKETLIRGSWNIIDMTLIFSARFPYFSPGNHELITIWSITESKPVAHIKLH